MGPQIQDEGVPTARRILQFASDPFPSFTNVGNIVPRATRLRESRTMPGAARRTQVDTIDGYIAGCAPEARPILRKIRTSIRRAVPQATELISYRMPAFKLNGIIIYFAAFQRHIGVFPPVRRTPALVKAVKPYAGPKGNLKFPLAGRIPYALIARIAKQRAKDNTSRVLNKHVHRRER